MAAAWKIPVSDGQPALSSQTLDLQCPYDANGHSRWPRFAWLWLGLVAVVVEVMPVTMCCRRTGDPLSPFSPPLPLSHQIR